MMRNGCTTLNLSRDEKRRKEITKEQRKERKKKCSEKKDIRMSK